MSNLRDAPLDVAKELINADRNQEYGEPAENFKDIADMATILMRPVLKSEARIEPHHVAMFMIAIKMTRMKTSPRKFDSWVDIAGYVGTGWEATICNSKDQTYPQRETLSSE